MHEADSAELRVLCLCLQSFMQMLQYKMRHTLGWTALIENEAKVRGFFQTNVFKMFNFHFQSHTWCKEEPWMALAEHQNLALR